MEVSTINPPQYPMMPCWISLSLSLSLSPFAINIFSTFTPSNLDYKQVKPGIKKFKFVYLVLF